MLGWRRYFTNLLNFALAVGLLPFSMWLGTSLAPELHSAPEPKAIAVYWLLVSANYFVYISPILWLVSLGVLVIWLIQHTRLHLPFKVSGRRVSLMLHFACLVYGFQLPIMFNRNYHVASTRLGNHIYHLSEYFVASPAGGPYTLWECDSWGVWCNAKQSFGLPDYDLLRINIKQATLTVDVQTRQVSVLVDEQILFSITP